MGSGHVSGSCRTHLTMTGESVHGAVEVSRNGHGHHNHEAAQICIIYSPFMQVVAERMRGQQAAQGLRIEWQVGDMLNLPFRDNCLDVVVEKGALDVFLVDRGSPWDPAPSAAARMRTALLEIHR